jgi:hypothetical protein
LRLRVLLSCTVVSISFKDWFYSFPRDLRLTFLQGLFEKMAYVDPACCQVTIPVGSHYLPSIMYALDEMGVVAHVVGANPLRVSLSLKDVAKLPLFSPDVKDGKYYRVLSLISNESGADGKKGQGELG